MASARVASPVERVSTGITGLDDILRGGFTPNRLYLVEGNPGSGKTTLALQFLLNGVARGETGLYVTLSETKEELISVGKSHGWDLSPINIFEMVASEEGLSPENQLTMFHPSELELSETSDDDEEEEHDHREDRDRAASRVGAGAPRPARRRTRGTTAPSRDGATGSRRDLATSGGGTGRTTGGRRHGAAPR